MKPYVKLRLQTESKAPITALKVDNGGKEKSSGKYTFVGQQNQLSLFNLSNGAEVLKYETYTNTPVNAIELLEQDKIVSCSNQILIHDKVSTVPFRKFENLNVDYRGKNVNDIKVLSENGLILSVDIDLRIWDLRQNNKFKPIQEFTYHSRDSLNSVDFNDGGVLISCGGNDGKLYTYDLRAGLLQVDDRFKGSPITSVNYHHDDGLRSDVLLMKCLGQGSLLYDVANQETLFSGVTSHNNANEIYKIDNFFLPTTISSSLRHQFVSGSENGKIFYFDGRETHDLDVCGNEGEPPGAGGSSHAMVLNCLDVSGEGDVVIGTGDGRVLYLEGFK